MAAKTTKIVLGILALLITFIIGVATGVMLMQVNPRQPNLTLLESLQKKSVGASVDVSKQPDQSLPISSTETK